MSVRIIANSRASVDGAALYDSVTGIAFGPVFEDEEEAEDFLEWLAQSDGRDARTIPVNELIAIRQRWRDVFKVEA